MSNSTKRDELWHCERAVDLTLALMASASTDRISPRDWWDRATSALTTAAARASSLPHMVSVMARKLTIDSLRSHSAEAINLLSSELSEPRTFETFRALCERDAIFVVAIARQRRQEAREESKEARAHNEPLEARIADLDDQVRQLRHANAQLSTRVADRDEQIRVLKAAIEGAPA